MKLRKFLGIKTTKHANYYRLYILWLPYMKIKFLCGVTKVYLFGVQIAHVPVIYQGSQFTENENILVNNRALEIIEKNKDCDYMKEPK